MANKTELLQQLHELDIERRATNGRYLARAAELRTELEQLGTVEPPLELPAEGLGGLEVAAPVLAPLFDLGGVDRPQLELELPEVPAAPELEQPPEVDTEPLHAAPSEPPPERDAGAISQHLDPNPAAEPPAGSDTAADR